MPIRCSRFSRRARTRPFCRESPNRNQPCPAATAHSTATAAASPSSAAFRWPAQRTGLRPDAPRPASTATPAAAASTPFLSWVRQLTGAEWSRPKQ